jgi:hypothetical protein
MEIAYWILKAIWTIILFYGISLLYVVRKFGWPREPAEWRKDLQPGKQLSPEWVNKLIQDGQRESRKLYKASVESSDGVWKIRIETNNDVIVAVETEITSAKSFLLNRYGYRSKGRAVFLYPA